MLVPFLIIGVGGSGGKTIRAMRQTLQRRLRAKGWKGEFPEAWQFLEIDTISTQGGGNFVAPLLPANQFLGLVPQGVEYAGLRNQVMQRLPQGQQNLALGGWLPEDSPVPIQRGAGQYRTLGRAVVASQLSQLQQALNRSYQRLSAPGVLAELTEVSMKMYGKADGNAPEPMALVISSVAGGSGAGIYLDVVEALKSLNASFEKTTQTLLFGPDVFNNIPLGMRGSVPANALGAMNETLAGMWAEGPGAGSAALFGNAGLNGRGAAGFGPRNTFLIGASNGRVSFGDQDSVYRAAGESLATLVSDEAVQTWMVEFAIVNVFVNSANPIICNDASMLKESNDVFHTQPLASIGVGRVSLGLDRFTEYIAEGSARWSVERLLWPQYEPPNPMNPQTPQQKVEEAVDRSWSQFLTDSGLNERGEMNDVIDALTPIGLEDRAKSFASAVINRASGGVPPAGLPSNQWISNVINFFNLQRKAYETDEQAEIYKAAQNWTVDIQDRVLRTVALVSARQGFNVACRLVEKLREEVQFVAMQELPLEASTEIRKLDQIASKISEGLPQGMSAVQTQAMSSVVGPIIFKAASFLTNSLRRTLAAELMTDLDTGFLQPLETSLRNSASKLLDSATTVQNSQGQQNPFQSFADISTGVIPDRFNPSVVESLLIQVSDFPKTLSELIRNSLDESVRANWEARFIERITLGTKLDSRGDNEEPSLIERKATWVPQNSNARRHPEGAQKARFEIMTNTEEFVERNRDWLSDPVTVLGKFLVQDLKEYLSYPDPTIATTRRTAYKSALSTALGLSAPLCSLNTSLIGVVHSNVLQKGERYVHMSTIPFTDQGDLKDLYDITVHEIQLANCWDPGETPKCFKSVGGIQQIDIFSTLASAMNPMVFSSLMNPVNESWGQNNSSSELREGFWTNRRSRPLTEAIPMAPVQVEKLVRGWFVSQLINLRTATRDQSRGPKISIFDPEMRKNVDFPHPLIGLRNESIVANADLLPAILESLGLAMAKCNQLNDLTPLEPYWAMIRLGGSYQEVLENWIRRGETSVGAPEPVSAIAGSASGTFSERKSAILTTLQNSQEFLTTESIKDERKRPWDISRTTEIRPLTDSALHDLIRYVEAMVDDAGIVV
jgi:hypothetical protein